MLDNDKSLYRIAFFEEASTVNCIAQIDESAEANPLPAPRTNILGVGMSVINMDQAIRLSDSLIRSNGQGYVCVTDVHGIVEAKSDATFRSILNGSFLTTPDGMPLVWVGRMRGHAGNAPCLRPRLSAWRCATTH